MSAGGGPGYVLDAWAVLAWLQAEQPAATRVAALLDQADQGAAALAISLVNLGEVYYRVAKAAGLDTARRTRRELESSPLRVEPVRAADVWAAAELKAGFPISYADAFAAALAARLDAVLVTGDPDFDAVAASGRVRRERLLRAG